MSIVSLVSNDETRQLTFICDRCFIDKFELHDDDIDEQNGKPSRLLPEVLLRVIDAVDDSLLDDLRVIITGISDGEYQSYLVASDNRICFPIRLVDAVLLSKISSVCLYVRKDVLLRQGSVYSKDDIYTKSMPISILPTSKLKNALEKALRDEDYRLAKVLSDELKNRK
ncbi:MAG: hypothetical protein MR717_06590 [Prevotella sp.]|nr:hypothetical protein [Prevotella sp.]MDD5895311.1 hypothetical protein [Prevotellaceae bacterium]